MPTLTEPTCCPDLDELVAFEQLVERRRATRHFLPDALDRSLIERLLRCAQWAPSSFNVQPTRFLVIEDCAIRPALRHVCMDQPQVEEAPVVVVFLGDRSSFAEKYESILESDLSIGAVSRDYAAMLHRNGSLMFGRRWLDWLWKALLIPLVRVFRPVPEVPAVHQRFWLAKQTMLSVMNFLLAAEAAGLATLPIEGFDPGRLSRVLNLPSSQEPILVVPLGVAVPQSNLKSRLPLSAVARWR